MRDKPEDGPWADKLLTHWPTSSDLRSTGSVAGGRRTTSGYASFILGFPLYFIDFFGFFTVYTPVFFFICYFFFIFCLVY